MGNSTTITTPDESSLSKENYKAMADVRRSLWTEGFKGMGYGAIIGFAIHSGAKAMQSWSMKRANVASGSTDATARHYLFRGLKFTKNTAFLSVMAGGAFGAFLLSSTAGKNEVHNLHPVFDLGKKNTFRTRYQMLAQQSQAIDEEKAREHRRLHRRETITDRMNYGSGLSDSHGGHWDENDGKD